MKNIWLKLSTILFIFVVFLSHASIIVITERLRNASVKEKGHSTSTVFSSKDEIPGYLKGISGQEQSVITPDDSRLSDKIEVIFYPVDGKSDNIDKSFFIAHNIEYTQSESFLVHIFLKN